MVSTLQQVTWDPQFPLLQDAKQIALSIYNASVRLKRNQVTFKSLAEDAYRFIYCVLYFCHNIGPDASQDLVHTLNELTIIRTLQSIQKLVQEAACRNRFTAWLRSRYDARKIKDHRLMLERCMSAFKVLSNMHVRNAAKDVMKGREGILTR